jgi:hypothetical protein
MLVKTISLWRDILELKSMEASKKVLINALTHSEIKMQCSLLRMFSFKLYIHHVILE